MLAKIIREPFVHFAILAVIAYLAVDFWSPASPAFNNRTIVINQEDLVTFMQKRDQVFDADLYRTKLAALSEQQHSNLVRQYTEQEVLYREAKSLGLDQNDEVLRRRMIQKLRYFLQGLGQPSAEVSPQQVEAYYKEHLADYEIPANITFTHIFFKQTPAQPTAQQRALQALQEMSGDSGINNLPVSDHFPYHRNYVRKSAAQIARHFGREFATEVFKLEAKTDVWQGPVASAYGQHLLQISGRQPAIIPQLAVIKQQVTEDLQRSLFAAAQQAQVDQLVQQYQVELAPQ
ncbi:MAG: peptidyl-prolyl cis-trans isomerase [Arenicella sp.]|nr:peptidyl-prolyl cis-trans isomerase [Arenicella sp.]